MKKSTCCLISLISTISISHPKLVKAKGLLVLLGKEADRTPFAFTTLKCKMNENLLHQLQWNGWHALVPSIDNG